MVKPGILRWSLVPTLLAAGAAHGQQDAFPLPEGESALPRHMTPEEAEWTARNPAVAEPAPRGVAATPTGSVYCVPEYDPMEGILVAWEGQTSWKNILRDMGVQITTLGEATFHVICDSGSERTEALSSLQGAGANMSRVEVYVRTTDSIWMRDYGPRFIYENGVRAVVDHTYNRPSRPNDNLLPDYFCSVHGFQQYQIPLVHGGGNFHLSGDGTGYSTALIDNENPSLSQSQIIDLWSDYQNLQTTITPPFPTSVDATQHIDMWMQIIADDAVVISDWPFNSGSTQDVICDSVAADMAALGYTVHRIPARSIFGTHYTFTNVVMCNDIVLIPSYTQSTAATHNAEALAVWQNALPDKTIIQINAQEIVTAAGVLHCIVMHVPESTGGENPVVYITSPNQPQTFSPDDFFIIRWMSDDNEGTTTVDIELSLDGGQTWPETIASGIADNGQHVWVVPDVSTENGRIRVTAHDADGNTGSDANDAAITILGTTPPCAADWDGSTTVDSGDFFAFIADFLAGDADIDNSGGTDSGDFFTFISAFLAGC